MPAIQQPTPTPRRAQTPARIRRCAALAGLLGALCGTAPGPSRAAAPEPDGEEVWVAQFSTLGPGEALDGWRAHTFPNIHGHTEYVLVADEDTTVLQATSRRAASALVRRIALDARRWPLVEWRWKIDDVVAGGRWGDKRGDDFAARLFVVFERPRDAIPLFGGLIRKMAAALPGRALTYVWASRAEPGQIARSPYSDQAAMIAVEAGAERARVWVTERRNVLEDFRTAFGTEPGRVVAVALMTDTDNTGSERVAYYGDIRFLAPDAQGVSGTR